MGILFNARDYAVIDHLVWQGSKKRIFERLKTETVQRVGSYLATNNRPPQQICEIHVEITPRRNQHQPTVWSMRSSVALRGDVWEATVEYFGPHDRTPFAEISIGSLLHSPKLLQEFYVTSWRGKTFHIEPVPDWDDSTPTNRTIISAESRHRHSLHSVGFASVHEDTRRRRNAALVNVPSPGALSHSARTPTIEIRPSDNSYFIYDETSVAFAGANLIAEFSQSIDNLPASTLVRTSPALPVHSKNLGAAKHRTISETELYSNYSFDHEILKPIDAATATANSRRPTEMRSPGPM